MEQIGNDEGVAAGGAAGEVLEDSHSTAERTLFLNNLPLQASPSRVRQAMSRVGMVSSVELETMTTTGMHNGRGVVVYETAEGARGALRGFNDKTMVVDARLVAVATTKWPTVGRFAATINHCGRFRRGPQVELTQVWSLFGETTYRPTAVFPLSGNCWVITFQVARERENAIMELSQLGASLGGDLVQAWPAPPGAVVLACSTLLQDGDGDGGGGGSGGGNASSGGGGGGHKRKGHHKGRKTAASGNGGPPTKRAKRGGGGGRGDGRTVAVGQVPRRTTKKELREHFETAASVEAVTLLMGKGKLPQDGFVTFTTQAGASIAIEHLDGSWLCTNELVVALV